MKKITSIFLLALAISLAAQTENLDHKEHDHDHHKNEIGIANSPVYLVKEKELVYGLHLHYVRNLFHSKFGVGIGFERVFDEHKHNTIGIVGVYRPIGNLSLSVSPGITFEDGFEESRFALHLESAYEWELGDFHVGPAFEFAYDQEDYHISLGLHVGYGF